MDSLSEAKETDKATALELLAGPVSVMEQTLLVMDREEPDRFDRVMRHIEGLFAMRRYAQLQEKLNA